LSTNLNTKNSQTEDKDKDKDKDNRASEYYNNQSSNRKMFQKWTSSKNDSMCNSNQNGSEIGNN